MQLKLYERFMKKKDKSNNVIKTYVVGTLLGLIMFLIGLLLISLILYRTKSSSAMLYYFPYVFIFLGAFLNAVYCHKRVGNRGFITGIITALPYSLLIILLCAIITDFSATAKLLVVVPISVIGGFLGGVMAANKKI